jgi:hypothetical protein
MALEGKANRFAIAALSVVRNVQAFRAEKFRRARRPNEKSARLFPA